MRAGLGSLLPPTNQPTARDFGTTLATRTCPAPGRVIWLCGSTGVGKSAVAWEVFSALRQRSTAANLDLQQLGLLGGPDAATNHALQAANVAAVWGCFHAAGATHLVMSGALDTTAQANLYRDALPATDVTLVRLGAERHALHDRVHARSRGDGPRLAGDRLIHQPPEALEHAATSSWIEQEQLDSASLAELVLDTTDTTPRKIAARLLRIVANE